MTFAALLALSCGAAASAFEEARVSSDAEAPPVPSPTRKLDEYGNIPFAHEKARLDNFAIELQSDPTARGYIIGYGGRRARAGEARRRLARAMRYLSTVRHIPAGQVVTIDGGYREDLTVELWIMPRSMTPPQPSPTVDPSEVVIIREQPKRRRPAGNPRRRN